MSRAVPAALIGLAPVMMVLLPWDFGRDMSFYRGLTRGLSLTVIFLEFLFILWSLAHGFNLLKAFRNVPEWSKLGIALLLLVMSLGAIYSARTPILASIGILKIAIQFVFFLALRDQLKNGDGKQFQLIWFAIGAGLLGYWLIWLINIWVYNPQGDDWVVLVPGVTNVRSLGFFAMAGFFASIAITETKLLDLPRVTTFTIGLVVAVAALVMMLWTGSRGGIIAISAGLLFILVFGKSTRSGIFRLASLSFLIAAPISMTLPAVNPNYGVERMVSSLTTASEGGDVSSGRLEMWKETVRKIKERPLIGWGVEQFAVSGPEKTLGFKQPHNVILQLLFSTGALGAIAVLLILTPVVTRMSVNGINPNDLAGWGYIVGAATYSLYDAAFYYTYPVMIFLFAVTAVVKSFSSHSVR